MEKKGEREKIYYYYYVQHETVRSCYDFVAAADIYGLFAIENMLIKPIKTRSQSCLYWPKQLLDNDESGPVIGIFPPALNHTVQDVIFAELQNVQRRPT